jgi:hypothetical protein
MKPVLNGPTYGVNPETLQFPYLEKTIKKYTCRDFTASSDTEYQKRVKSTHVVSITVPFVCSRDYQEDIVETYINHIAPI